MLYIVFYVLTLQYKCSEFNIIIIILVLCYMRKQSNRYSLKETFAAVIKVTNQIQWNLLEIESELEQKTMLHSK